jgi:hypothetical protein
MRTTLDIQSDVLEAARVLAAARGISVGAALSELARRGLDSRTPLVLRNGFPVFQIPPATPCFGANDVEEAERGDDGAASKWFSDTRT